MKDLKLLIIQSQAGDLDAFGTIVQKFQDMALGYAYSILRDFHLAEDAAQEAFIKAYRCLSKLSNLNAFPGWFRKIVFKHCDRLTRGKRIETVPMKAVVEIASHEKSPHEIVEEQEMKDNVLAAIAALPEHERVVTALFYINGYSQNEIANFLEIPVTTVNSRLRYSRKRLKERMMTMVQETLHENRPSRDNQFVERVLKFPKDHSIGILYVRDGIEGASLGFYDWVELGQAQNTVKVASGQALALQIGIDKKNDIAALSLLSPDDLQALEVGHIDNNDDFRFMTHFRGLRYVSVFNRGYNLGDEGLARLIRNGQNSFRFESFLESNAFIVILLCLNKASNRIRGVPVDN